MIFAQLPERDRERVLEAYRAHRPELNAFDEIPLIPFESHRHEKPAQLSH